jgi:hypothetical protein
VLFRSVPAAVGAAIANFNYPAFTVKTGTTVEAALEDYATASQQQHDKKLMVEHAALAQQLKIKFGVPNAFPVCQPCTAKHGFNFYSMGYIGGHGARSGSSKSMGVATTCTVSPHDQER